jgi:uncharacterized peroxidase-related enzyme
MARVSLIEAASASTEVQHIYEHRLRGKPGSIHKAMAHLPQALTAFLSFYPAVGRTLPPRVYELVYIRVSMLNQCDYCMQHHRASSKRAGVTAEDWKALNDPQSAPFTEREKAALAYVEKLTRTPWEISDADVQSLRSHDLNDTQIVDLNLLVGLANLTNRFTDPLGLELEFEAEKS